MNKQAWTTLMTRILIPLPYSYVSQGQQSEKEFLSSSDFFHLRPYIPTYLSTPKLLKYFSTHTRLHTRSNLQIYHLPQFSFYPIILYIRHRSRSFIFLSSSHITLPMRHFQIQSTHILSVVLPYVTAYLF